MINADCVLAVDVDGDRLAAAVVRADGTVMRRRDAATPTSTRAGVVTGVLRSLVAAVATSVPAERIAGMGIGSAGPLDPAEGTVSPLDIPAWREYPVVDALRDLVPGRPVRLASGGQCAALGEYRYGGGWGSRGLLSVGVGTAIVGGVVVGGHPYPGATGNAGHIGHVVVEPGGTGCRCGGRGCLETVASVPAIVRWARERGWDGPDLAALAAGARDGHPVAAGALERAGRALGVAVVSATALLDLDDVVIAGTGQDELLVTSLRRAVAESTNLEHVRRAEIRASALGGDATLLGAACLAFAPPDPDLIPLR